jgi:hypothetical protein
MNKHPHLVSKILYPLVPTCTESLMPVKFIDLEAEEAHDEDDLSSGEDEEDGAFAYCIREYQSNCDLPEAFIVKEAFLDTSQAAAAAAQPSTDPSRLLQVIAESKSAEELALEVERRYRVASGAARPVEGDSCDELVGSFRTWCRQLWKFYVRVCSLVSQFIASLKHLHRRTCRKYSCNGSSPRCKYFDTRCNRAYFTLYALP